MKSRTYRLPDKIADDIDAEARKRKVSASDVARERLSGAAQSRPSTEHWQDSLSNFVGAIDGLPHGDSRNIKSALKASGYGRNRTR